VLFRSINEQFNYDLLLNENNQWQYKNVIAKNIIFCEGYKNIYNPFFGFLPFVLCKGEVFTIKCEKLNSEKIIKKGIYLVPLGKHLFKVGATYEWNDLSEAISEEGKNFLVEKLNQLLMCEYEIITHEANVRPTTKDRKAILGEHFKFSNMYIFNGLGTKGILQAPYLSKQLYEHIVNKKEIDAEVSINRFQKLFN
jgi:glycine/D-amino acid oxidase-like deaminating enzyme